MSRYRPPSPKSSPYITAEGARKLRAELQRRKEQQLLRAVHHEHQVLICVEVGAGRVATATKVHDHAVLRQATKARAVLAPRRHRCSGHVGGQLGEPAL